jgi:hypothetical protein
MYCINLQGAVLQQLRSVVSRQKFQFGEGERVPILRPGPLLSSL